MTLWSEAGPWAGRRLAASIYVLDYGGAPVPKTRNWAARSLDFVAPSPFFSHLATWAFAC